MQATEGEEDEAEESLEETAARVGTGSIKSAAFQALREAGADGLDVLALVQAVQVKLFSSHPCSQQLAHHPWHRAHVLPVCVCVHCRMHATLQAQTYSQQGDSCPTPRCMCRSLG